MRTRFAVLALAALLTAAGGPLAPPLAAQAPGRGVVAITGATVYTVTGGTIQNGTVVVRDGKIAAVGADVAVPRGATVVEAKGRFLTPGLIDAHSHIAADSINEGGTSVSSMTGIEDVLDPTDIDIYRDLAGGLTTANVLHGSANPIGGKNAVIKLRWGRPRAEDLLFEGALPGIKFALGENPKDMRQFGQTGPRRYPATRLGVEFVIRDAFTRAKAYQKEWRDYERRRKAGEPVVAPRRDLQLDPLVEVLEGKRLVHAHCYRADEILMLLRLAEEIGFRITTLQHVLEGYQVAKEIAAHGAGASTFSDWWGYKIEAMGATPYNAALMHRRGVLVSVNSDSAEHARRLNTEAAKSIKWGGLTEDEALALVTINPAKQLKIEKRVGSIEVGKDADLTLWTHHPLSSYAIVDKTWIDGEVYYDRAHEDERVAELRKKKDALIEAEKADAKKKPAPKPTDTTENQAPDATGGGHGSGDAAADGTNGAATPLAPSAARGEPVAQAAAPAAGVVAIVNARITPVSSPVIEKGAIVIRNGVIEAIGADVRPPDGAEVIDAKGGEVYPGWISGASTIGLADPGPRGFQDTAEMLDFNPHLRTIMSYHPDSEAIPVARVNGITTVAVVPSGGVLAGQVAVVNLDGWTWEEAALRRDVGAAFEFPSIRPQGGFGAAAARARDRTYEDLKKERDRKLEEVGDLLARARAYAKTPPASRVTDWVLDSLVPVASGRLPLVISANREADIREAVAFAEKHQVRMILNGGLEAPLVADLLKEKGVPVILGPVLTLPTRADQHHAETYRAAAALARAGVRFAFTTGSDPTAVRQLPYQAAQSVAWGLPRDAAIRALTLDAAEILGVADRVGSLAPGKLANLFIADGDPLEIRTAVTHVFIAGRDVGQDTLHVELYERYKQRP